MLLNETLVARLHEENLVLTGGVEVTDLQDIDTAFCNKLLSAFEGVIVTDPRRETLPFAEFLKRAPSDQIKFGEFEDVGTFLTAYQSAKAGRAQEPQPGVNPLALPIISVFRPIDFLLYQGDITRDMPWCGTLETKENGTFALLSKTHAQVSYTVTLISDEKHTLNRMCTTLGVWISMIASLGGTNFTASSKLAGTDIKLGAEFIDPKTVMFGNVSLPASDNRIYASQFTVDVVADILIAYSVDSTPRTVEVYTGVVPNG